MRPNMLLDIGMRLLWEISSKGKKEKTYRICKTKSSISKLAKNNREWDKYRISKKIYNIRHHCQVCNPLPK